MIRYLIRGFLHLFFPNRCPFCGDCMAFSRHCCEKCQAIVDERKPFLMQAESSMFWFDRVIAPFSYEDEPSKAVKDLKFHETVSNAEHLSYYLWCDLLEQDLCRFDVIIPVPMTKKRRRKRGFNQAEKLSKELSIVSHRPVCSRALVKIRETKEQHTLNERQRRENLKGAFLVMHSSDIRGKRVLLVDDVFTTGSTANECAKMLKGAGAVSVEVGVICKVQAHFPLSEEKQ
jgi:competence protein ComFC